MAKSYVKFEVPKEVADKAYEAVKLAVQNGNVRKGVNEVTKSIERGLPTIVVVAEDVEPEEVIMHVPTLCEQRKIALVFVPEKEKLGAAAGLKSCAAVAIEKGGEAAPLISDIIAKVTGKASKGEAKGEEAKPAKAEKPKKAKEAKQEETKTEEAPEAEAEQ